MKKKLVFVIFALHFKTYGFIFFQLFVLSILEPTLNIYNQGFL